MWGDGPAIVITDLGVLSPDPESNELRLTAVHPGVEVDQVRSATGWALAIDADLATTGPPSDNELEVLRSLKTRTEAAHSR
jgi:glutaconate CoA-transferase subunit B